MNSCEGELDLNWLAHYPGFGAEADVPNSIDKTKIHCPIWSSFLHAGDAWVVMLKTMQGGQQELDQLAVDSEGPMMKSPTKQTNLNICTKYSKQIY